MNKKTLILIIILLIAVCTVTFGSDDVFAQNYNLLESVPSVGEKGNPVSFPQYVTGIYKFATGFVVIAALLMITIGGFYYITSAGNQAQAGTAKKIITDALLGLVVVFLAYLILVTINPDLIKANPDMSGLHSSGEMEDIVDPDNEPPENDGEEGSCNGVATIGINTSQCADTSEELGKLLKCLNENMPGLRITSISDDDATNDLSACQGSNWSHPPCDHTRNSCHYGGSGNNSKSCAVDISTRPANLPQGVTVGSLMDIGNVCGAAFTKDESRSANHIHFSVRGCACDGHM